MDTLKMQYDHTMRMLAQQAKKRRLAREAGAEWKTGSAEEVKYWRLKSKMELLAKKMEKRNGF